MSNLENLKVQEELLRINYDYAAKYFGEHLNDREARDNANAAHDKLWQVKAQIAQAEAPVH